ncbi:MAG: cytochrome P450 [Polyangiaceae bacterium]
MNARLSNTGLSKGGPLTKREKRPLPPGPGGLSSLTNPWTAWRDPIGLFRRMTRDYGNVAMITFGPLKYVIVNDPAAIKYVLLDNAKNYVKSRHYRGIKLILGNGLLTSEGDFWRRQRKLAQPAFHRERLSTFIDSMTLATDAMFERWRARGDGKAFETDIHEEMMASTFHIVGLTLLSVDLLGEADQIGKALSTALYFANDYAESIVPIPLWVPTPKNRRFIAARKSLDEVVLRVIGERRAARKGGQVPAEKRGKAGDLLDMLMDAKDEDTGEQMSDGQLRDEVMTMVLAGHETTANALTFSLYLLSQHPDIARRVAKEVTDVLGGRTPKLEDLPKLGLVKRVLEESMRLYPPAWAFERQALEEDEINGFRIPKGAVIGVCPFVLQRDPVSFDNPEGFDPDRFLAENSKERGKYTYLPFGGGARVCIGSQFAMMEAELVLAKIVQEWKIDLLPITRLELDPVITLRPRGGLAMRIAPKKQTAT